MVVLMIRRILACIAAVGALTAPPTTGAQPRRILIEAERFSFTPSRVTIAEGDEVEFVLRSADTTHGFKVEGTDIAVVIPKRGKGDATVTYKAARPGRFSYECHRLCGAGHHFMRGEIVVKPREP
jgi:cytochrome c oxidase subunit 2